MQVARVHTPLQWATARGELTAAFRALTGAPLPAHAVPYLLAMLHVENREGNATYNHNWGNVTTASDAVSHFVHEGIPLKFRSFPSHQAGARAFLETLMNRINRPAFDAMTRDDFDGWFNEVRDHYAAPPPGHQGLTEQHRRNYRYLVDKFREGTQRIAQATSDSASLIFLLAAAAGVWWFFSQKKGGSHA